MLNISGGLQMEKMGIILTSKTIRFKYIPQKILTFLPKRWVDWLIVRFKKEQYHYFELKQIEIGVEVGRIPVTSKQLQQTDEYVIKYFLSVVRERFKQQGIKNVLLYKEMEHIKFVQDIVYGQQGFVKIREDIFLTALCMDIIKKTCKAKGLEMKTAYIGIVEKTLTQQSLFVIEQLSPHIRYITVVTDDAKIVQQQLDDIYEEVGLAVRVSNNASVSLKAADIIIVLDDIVSFLQNTQINKDTILFNLSEKSNILYPCRNIIIDGIEVQGDMFLDSTFVDWHDICKDKFIKYVLILKSKAYIHASEKQMYQNIRSLFYKMHINIKQLRSYKKRNV